MIKLSDVSQIMEGTIPENEAENAKEFFEEQNPHPLFMIKEAIFDILDKTTEREMIGNEIMTIILFTDMLLKEAGLLKEVEQHVPR